MTELSPAARALVDAAREGLAPDPAAIRRMRANIAAATVGGGAAATVGGAVGGAKLALAVKLAILAAVTGTIVGAYVLSRSSDDAAAGAPHVSTRDEPPPVASAPTPPARATPTIDDSTGVDSDAIELDPPAKAAASRSQPHPPGATAASTTAPATTAPAVTAATATATPLDPATNQPLPVADLAREVALVDRAMAALRDGDPNGALGAIRRYDLETRGKGQLAEDAAAIAVEALCLRDDPSANAKLQAFDARWPHSAQRARVRATCQR